MNTAVKSIKLYKPYSKKYNICTNTTVKSILLYECPGTKYHNTAHTTCPKYLPGDVKLFLNIQFSAAVASRLAG